MEKIKVNEVIIVEGRDDVTALKRVIEGHIIALRGFSGLTETSLKRLVEISKKKDLILFTDPDYAGKKIRNKIRERIPELKHIFISRKNAEKNGNIGVENASDETIRQAFANIVQENSVNKSENPQYIFTMSDLISNNLCSGKNSRERREKLGDLLRIGYYNSKQLLNALNNFNIGRKEFEKAIEKLNEQKNDGM